MDDDTRLISIGKKKFIINPIVSLISCENFIIFDSCTKRVIIKNLRLKDLNIQKVKNQEKAKKIKKIISLLRKNNILIPYSSSFLFAEIEEIHKILKLTARIINYNNEKRQLPKDFLNKDFEENKLRICSLSKDFRFLYNRKSTRRFNERKNLKLSLIEKIVNIAYGIIRIDGNGVFHRTVPSAGAFYPCKIIYFDFKSKKLYFHTGYRLKFIKKFNNYQFNYLLNGIRSNKMNNIDFKNAQGFIFIFADLSRIIIKYGLRGYYFALLEAGHILQGLNLACANYSIGICELGLPLDDGTLRKILGINNKYVLNIINCIIGIPSNEN